MSINNQVWRYTISTATSTPIAAYGVDPSGAMMNFVFLGGKTNLLQLDRLGNLWIGDDPTDGLLNFRGRVFYISAAALAAIP